MQGIVYSSNLGIMVSLKYLSRYKDLAWLFMKYGRSDIVKKMGLPLPPEEPKEDIVLAKELTQDLVRLGPTFIKLGQFLSTQVDFLPDAVQEALSQLQDNVEPFPFAEVEKIFHAELGVPIKDVFLEFQEKPLAGASLSQVHQATLRNGCVVAVKIQRPGIQEKILDDLNMLEELAQFLDKNELFGKYYYWEDKIKSMRTALLNELDFRKEARNLQILGSNLKEFDLIIVPQPVMDFTSVKVLTMEYISSRKITTLHPLLKMEMDGEKLAEQLLQAYLKQIFIDGFVHIDPHPGNIYFTDTNQIAILDLGMIERLTPQLQLDLLKLIFAISEGKGEEIANIVIKVSHQEKDFAPYKLQEEIANIVAEQQDLSWGEIGMGKMLLGITNHAARLGLRMPQKFNTLGKTLLHLDGIVKVLAPDFRPQSFIRDNVSSLLQRKMGKLFTEANFSKIILELSDLIFSLPRQLSTFVDQVSKKEWTPRIQILDERYLMQGFEKVANRIAFGLVLAALIIGAALLMRIETSFQIWGYPGLAMLLFLAATLGGVLFLLNILLYDEKK